MNCEEASRLLEAFLDRELGPEVHLEVEQHLSRCPACRSVVHESQEFRFFFAAAAPTYKAPPELRTEVLAAVRQASAKQTFLSLDQPWVYAAAVVVVSLGLALNLLLPDNGKELCSLAVLDHIRSLADNHLVDVTSADRHVLKPWFAAKLDFSPPVIDRPASAYALMGGRVDMLRNDPVAVCVYNHKKEIVTLFCWPANKHLVLDRAYVIQGYHVCSWRSSTCNYIVVSKSSGRGLDEYVDSFRDRVDSSGNQLPPAAY